MSIFVGAKSLKYWRVFEKCLLLLMSRVVNLYAAECVLRYLRSLRKSDVSLVGVFGEIVLLMTSSSCGWWVMSLPMKRLMRTKVGLYCRPSLR